MDLSKFKTEILIDCLPQNRPLYKDSGLWQIRTDDMEDVIFHQTCNETFSEFIERYCQTLCNDETFLMDLGSNIPTPATVSDADVEKLAEDWAAKESSSPSDWDYILKYVKKGIELANTAPKHGWSDEDMVDIAEWMKTETSYKRYSSDDDNDGKWYDEFSEGINRHYYSDKELLEQFKKTEK